MMTFLAFPVTRFVRFSLSVDPTNSESNAVTVQYNHGKLYLAILVLVLDVRLPFKYIQM